MKFVMQFILLILACSSLFSEEGYRCSFPKISLVELLRYAGKSAQVNFIADEKILDFDVVFISQNNRSSEDLLEDLFKLLNEYDLEAAKDG